MRVTADIEVEAGRQEIWDVITDPEEVPAILEDVTRWDVLKEQDRGLGARYNMRILLGSAEVGSEIEVVEWDEPNDMAWVSVKGIDQRGRWRLRDCNGGTKV